MLERGQSADHAATDCKERLIASKLDNDGSESGQEDASGLRQWALPIWRVPGNGPARAARAAKAERGAGAGPASPLAPRLMSISDIRHTGNTLAAEAGASLGELMNRMGCGFGLWSG